MPGSSPLRSEAQEQQWHVAQQGEAAHVGKDLAETLGIQPERTRIQHLDVCVYVCISVNMRNAWALPHRYTSTFIEDLQ